MRKEIVQLKKWLGYILNIMFILCIIVLLMVLLQLFVFASFKIPTDSMEPILVSGDYILVDKCSTGARIFNVMKALDDKEVSIYRMPGWRDFERNDIIVFNFPYPRKKDSIGFNVMKYYVKRCVALPGDTFEIKDATYSVRGYKGFLGNVRSQGILKNIIERGDENYYGIVFKGRMFGSLGWSIANFGPFYVPKKGDCIPMFGKHALLYRNLIEWEQRKKLVCRGDTVWLGDSIIRRYRFRENYYFVAGDRVANSQDSLYWGLLPEPFIVGKAVRIWKSVDPLTGKVRWDRVWKRIE